jgi:hypothetical protein
MLLLAQAPAAKPSLEELAGFMVGSFSSAEQANQDPKHFFDIRLEVVRIWPERKDGTWLYVEQAAADSLAKPYRQRVYRLSAGLDGRFESVISTFKDDPLKHAGAWRERQPLAALAPKDLDPRRGCAVFLAADGKGAYVGATRAQDCESNLRGAAYATTEVRVDAQGMLSWDRGYDKAGKQVWGATEGGYRFNRVK